MRKGIDVSSYQGNINWEQAKDHIDFAIIRCGYGNNIVSQDDIKYERNVENCTSLKIPFGVYLYSYATNLKMAQSEVDHTLRLIKDYQLEYPVFLDVEDRSQLNLPKEELINIVKYYCEKIEAAGYYVGIYASLSTLNGILNSDELSKYDKWVAEWSKDFSYKGSSGLWQNTNNDSIPGIDTRVDGDIAFYDYPEIIRKNGLNHLETTEKTELKYKTGETLYLNGPLYQDEKGEKVIKNYKNKIVTITKTNNTPKTKAPYEVDKIGNVEEKSLTKDKLTSPCVFVKIIQFIMNLFKK